MIVPVRPLHGGNKLFLLGHIGFPIWFQHWFPFGSEKVCKQGVSEYNFKFRRRVFLSDKTTLIYVAEFLS